MDLEELNKSQVVLLTLLVSFVTSIATGIVTVSLMEQAPSDVTRVIQKTVERTVEKVAPPEIQTKIITQEKTVIVSDSDLIASAIELNIPSIVRIYEKSGEEQIFTAVGVVISSGGVVATDALVIKDGADYTVKTDDYEYMAKLSYSDKEKQIALLELLNTETVPKPASLLTSTVKLGNAVVLLSGEKSVSVNKGIVTEVKQGAFSTNLNSAQILPGSVLINIDGNIVGINTATSEEMGSGWFLSANAIKNTLKSLNEDKLKEDQEKEQSVNKKDQTASAANSTEAKDESQTDNNTTE